MTKQPAPTDHIFLHVRDIHGQVIRSYMHCPLRHVPVPSLGLIADRCLDGFGIETSTISLLYKTYIEATQLKIAVRYFVNQMVTYGMPRLEASLWWDLIEVAFDQNGEPIYRGRDRVDLSIQ